ncbi:MAG: DUF86 domain-containing protein [Acidobacteriia bacterium]|nr:DUF86 domain-containing protein [Terriglobia bacterium]
MPAKDPLVYIMHIRDSCRRIAEYTITGGDNWTSQPLIMDAVCRNITIIGEAARKLDDSFHRAHPEIPWSGIIGARNIVMHAYEFLRPELIREMAEEDVPELLAHCLRLLGEE